MTREEMIAYLKGHFRYDTMNSWNAATSYAKNIKVHHLGLTRAQQDAVCAALEVEGSFEASGFSDVLDQFGEDHDWRWQIGTNGRSGGYLVLYQGALEPVGRTSPHRQDMRAQCFPGRSTDQGEDFEIWDDESLGERVQLVQEFDEACAAAVSTYVAWAEEHEVVEETISVLKTIKVARPRGDVE